jgi:hypothetical protein
MIKLTDFCGEIEMFDKSIFHTEEAFEAFKRKIENGTKQVSIVHQKITNKDGRVLYRFLGTNSSVIGGTQNMIFNTFDGLTDSDMTAIGNLDSESGMNLDTVSKYLGNTRKIFGFGIGNDGAHGEIIYPVKRHTKGYDITKLHAFNSINTGLEVVADNFSKYAFRHKTNDGYAQYYLKKATPKFSNINVNNQLLPDNPDTSYHGNAEVMSRVVYNFKIEANEVLPFWGYKTGSTQGCTINSIMLFAGRPCEVQVGGTVHQTYRDIICTHKINFTTWPIKDTQLEFEYALYYV